MDREGSIRAIRRMVDLGVNLIDTAPCYGTEPQKKIVGEAIRTIPRDKILLSTKFGLVPDVFKGDFRKEATYKNAMREVESSLMNLDTDYIDFYFCTLAGRKHSHLRDHVRPGRSKNAWVKSVMWEYPILRRNRLKKRKNILLLMYSSPLFHGGKTV